jgi:hypothetical protein
MNDDSGFAILVLVLMRARLHKSSPWASKLHWLLPGMVMRGGKNSSYLHFMATDFLIQMALESSDKRHA